MCAFLEQEGAHAVPALERAGASVPFALGLFLVRPRSRGCPVISDSGPLVCLGPFLPPVPTVPSARTPCASPGAERGPGGRTAALGLLSVLRTLGFPAAPSGVLLAAHLPALLLEPAWAALALRQALSPSVGPDLTGHFSVPSHPHLPGEACSLWGDTAPSAL